MDNELHPKNWTAANDQVEPPQGGVKFDHGKARYDLIPPEVEEAIAKVLTYGAQKYTTEIQNEWDALLYAQCATALQVLTLKGSVVDVTRNTYESPIPSLQNANVKIEGLGSVEIPTRSLSWQSVDALIRQHVAETPKPNGTPALPNTGLPKPPMPHYALKGAQSVAPPNTCTLTIVTSQGILEVYFAPDAITDLDFWTIVWRGLSEHFGISRPQNKSGERNWEEGMSWGRVYAAMRRHTGAWWRRLEDNDPESGMPHLWHAAACIAFLVAFEARGDGDDNRPKRKKK
jgi:hypothetical protein